MVIYLDLVFALNSLSDALALYVTARLSGRVIRWPRMVAAALLGGAYAVLCVILPVSGISSFCVHGIVAALLVYIAFHRQEMFLRQVFLFFMLSCTMGGVFMAFAQLSAEHGLVNILESLNWKVFFLAGILSWFLLSVVFRNSVGHAVSGQISHAVITLNGRSANVAVLHDTGHTLMDPATGETVLTVWYDALQTLWDAGEWGILSSLESSGSVQCVQRLSEIVPGRYRLLPYRAVGVREGMLLCFRADEVIFDGRTLGALTISLSPTPLSDGGGYAALWGGERIRDANA